MYQESKLDKIDKKISTLIQLQDLSTIQTALLAIIFGLFIFSITAITNRYNDLVYVFSFIMLFIELIVLLYLLSSIFASNFERKVELFLFVVWFLILIITYISVSLLYFGLSLKLTSTFTVSNTGVVFLFLITFALAVLIDKKIDKKLKKRFFLLYEKEKIILTGNKLLDVIDRVLYKFIRMFAISFLIATIISIASGLVEISTYNYGFPFAWFIQKMDGKSFVIDYIGLYSDFIVFTALICIIFSVVKYFRNGKKVNVKNIPGFTPYKK